MAEPTKAVLLLVDINSGKTRHSRHFSGLNSGEQVRSYIRVLQTSEALGLLEQTVARMASPTVCLMLWAGLTRPNAA